MTDKTLTGFGVEEQEVDAIYAALVGNRDGDDLLHHYRYLSSRQALLEEVSQRIAGDRAQIAAELYDDLGEGRSYAKVADILGISRARAQQFVERARGADGTRE